MSANYPTWREIWFKAKRERCRIVATVMMHNDEIRTCEFGPRGGWKFVK